MAAALTHADILSVRDASRRMVRDLGFLRPTLAGTDLSASAVHAIVEIGNHGALAAQQLAEILILDKSTVSRLVGRLVSRGLVTERSRPLDGRTKPLVLTGDGKRLFGEIDNAANLQVGRALLALDAEARKRVVAGMRAYASGLSAARRPEAGQPQDEIVIVSGLRPGAIGRIAEMHGRYYAREWGFGPSFEAKVASGLAEFSQRLDRPVNGLWLALRQGEICGSAAIDGEDLASGHAHLRWVIVDDGLREAGLGRALLAQALAFADRCDFATTELWTFKGLEAARRLYERAGFALVDEQPGTQWGKTVDEQRFLRYHPHPQS